MKILKKGLAGLAVRRKRAGFTQQSFADELGIERARYANYEVGIAWPPASLLPAMAGLLGCSIDDLYEPMEENGEALCRGCYQPPVSHTVQSPRADNIRPYDEGKVILSDAEA